MVIFRSFVRALRIIKNIISKTIWVLISSYLIVAVLLHIPAVQRLIGDGLEGILARKFGTTVEVGRVNLGMLNRVTLDDILVYDQQQKKMLQITRLATRLNIIEILGGENVSISSIQLFGLKANLYKNNAQSKPNFQFVVDSLSSGGADSGLNLKIQSIIVRHGAVKYDDNAAPVKHDVISANHIDLKGISGHFVLESLTDKEAKVTVRSLAFEENSGLAVKNLRFSLLADKYRARINDFELELGQSRISIPRVEATYRTIEKGIDLDAMNLYASIASSKLSPVDMAFLDRRLGRYGGAVYFSGDIEGGKRLIKIRKLNLRSSKPFLSMRLDGQIVNPFGNMKWNIRVASLHVGRNTCELFARDWKIPIPKEIIRSGDVHFAGYSAGDKESVSLGGILKSDLGRAKFNLKSGKTIQLAFSTQGFNVGRVFNNSRLGMLTARMNVRLARNLSSVWAKGTVTSFDFNGYSYKNIAVDGDYSNDTFNGMASINDAGGTLSVRGRIENIRGFIEKRRHIIATVKIDAKSFNPERLNVTKAVNDKSFSFSASIEGRGSSLDNIVGSLSLENFSMTEKNEQFAMNSLKLKVDNSMLRKMLNVRTDFGEVNLNGQYDYTTLERSVVRIARTYFPMLFKEPWKMPILSKYNTFYIYAKLEKSDWLKPLLGLNLDLPSALSLNGKIDERTNSFNIYIDAPRVVYSEQTFTNTNITMLGIAGDMLVQASTQRMDAVNRPLSLKLNGKVHNGTIDSKIDFVTPGKTPMHGNIDSRAILFRSQNMLGVHMHFNPSEIIIDTIRLNLQPSEFTYVKGTLDIDHFEVSNRNQHIIINGQTTGNPHDSLTIHLKEINVPYVLDLLNFRSVAFGGVASGSISLKSIFTHPQMRGALDVKDFTFEHGDMGLLHAEVDYNHRDGKLNIDAKADAGADSYTDIKGYVDIKNSYINLPIYAHDTRLYFIKNFCGSFMDDINATANGWCKVVGPLSNINLEGDMYASGTLRMTPIGTKYHLNDCRIKMIPNNIIFEKDTVADAEGHIGIITGGLHHRELRALTYDINIESRNLLVYNFPKRSHENSIFWGKVYASGRCNIVGRSGETTINVDAIPNKNSFITYNAAKNNTIDENSFIKWRDPTPDSTLTIHFPNDSLKKVVRRNNFHDKFSSDLRINFTINTNPDFALNVLMDEVNGDNIVLNGSGGIRATYYNKGALQMFGNFNIVHGAYNLTIQNIIKKQFTFQQGSAITFGGDPLNANLNLKGLYTLNSVPLSDLHIGNSFTSNNTRVNCQMNIEGTPEQPTVTFGLDLPNLSADAQQMVHSILNSEQDMNQQVLYLLAVGRFYPQETNNAAQEGAAMRQTSLAMQSLLSGTLSQQINTVLSNVVKNSNWNFGANIATGNEGFSNAEYEGLLSGSLLNNRLLFNGEFGYRDNVATNNSSFIGDFDIRYLLFPSGSLSLRFYNHTNDRYFTRNSLTTQGVGLILKKDFHTVWDLFGLRRGKRKKGKRSR